MLSDHPRDDHRSRISKTASARTRSSGNTAGHRERKRVAEPVGDAPLVIERRREAPVEDSGHTYDGSGPRLRFYARDDRTPSKVRAGPVVRYAPNITHLRHHLRRSQASLLAASPSCICGARCRTTKTGAHRRLCRRVLTGRLTPPGPLSRKRPGSRSRSTTAAPICSRDANQARRAGRRFASANLAQMKVVADAALSPERRKSSRRIACADRRTMMRVSPAELAKRALKSSLLQRPFRRHLRAQPSKTERDERVSARLRAAVEERRLERAGRESGRHEDLARRR